jgi:hypothetical protein
LVEAVQFDGVGHDREIEQTAGRPKPRRRHRSDAIRQLIELGLDRSVVKTRQPKKPRQQRSS